MTIEYSRIRPSAQFQNLHRTLFLCKRRFPPCGWHGDRKCTGHVTGVLAAGDGRGHGAGGGLEPPRFHHWNLNPARLPIPPRPKRGARAAARYPSPDCRKWEPVSNGDLQCTNWRSNQLSYTRHRIRQHHWRCLLKGIINGAEMRGNTLAERCVSRKYDLTPCRDLLNRHAAPRTPLPDDIDCRTVKGL